MSFWSGNSLKSSISNQISKIINKNSETASQFPKWGLIICRIIFFLLVNNIMGLFPWIFTATSHISFTLRIGLPLWLGWMIMSLYSSFQRCFASIVPSGISFGLAIFLALVERIGFIIRPLTLSLRLAANIIAGHLILSLIAGFISRRTVILLWGWPLLLCITTLEVAVSLIQAYVFTALLTLYFR